MPLQHLLEFLLVPGLKSTHLHGLVGSIEDFVKGVSVELKDFAKDDVFQFFKTFKVVFREADLDGFVMLANADPFPL